MPSVLSRDSRAVAVRGLSGAFPAMVRAGACTSAVVLAVCLGAAWMYDGDSAATSALAGAGLAPAFFMVGALALRAVLAGPAEFLVAGAMSVYVLQIFGLLGAIGLLRSVPHLVAWAFALGALAEAVVWQAAQAWALLRTRQLCYSGLRMPGDPA